MAVSVKMSSKNQIVVPSEARKALQIKPGERLVVTVRDDEVIEMRKAKGEPAALLEGLLPGRGGDSSLWPEARGG